MVLVLVASRYHGGCRVLPLQDCSCLIVTPRGALGAASGSNSAASRVPAAAQGHAAATEGGAVDRLLGKLHTLDSE